MAKQLSFFYSSCYKFKRSLRFSVGSPLHKTGYDWTVGVVLFLGNYSSAFHVQYVSVFDCAVVITLALNVFLISHFL